MDNLFLIVGLGNPGREYENTPHNIGFEVVDALRASLGAPDYQKKFQGLFSAVDWREKKVLLLKPQTYMNLSGSAVGEAMRFYKLDPAAQLLVLVDDLDLPLGQLRLRKSGGPGGHNGLKSVQQAIGSEGYPRLRIGIGRGADASSHVLSKIKGNARATLDAAVTAATDGVLETLRAGIDIAMNKVNQRNREDGA